MRPAKANSRTGKAPRVERGLGPLRRVLCVVLFAAACQRPTDAAAAEKPAPPLERSVHAHTVTTLRGESKRLAEYRGKVLLVVNTASECGFTPQYAPLEALYQRFKERGLVVMAFPSNDFGAQEPGDAKAIEEFCSSRYKVSFPLFAKIHARGPDVSPLYRTLTEASPESARGEIRWNFTKFLVNRRGEPVARFEPVVDPLNEALISQIERLLNEPAPAQ